MMLKADIDIAIGIAKSIISLVENIDPQAADNAVVKELNRLIDILQSIGL